MKHLVVVDRWFASSKLCSTPGCGWKYSDLDRSEREWVCPMCGAHHDREVNASRNIRTEGLRLLSDRGVLDPGPMKSPTSLNSLNNKKGKLAHGYGESLNGCGECVRLPMGAAPGEAAKSP